MSEMYEFLKEQLDNSPKSTAILAAVENGEKELLLILKED